LPQSFRDAPRVERRTAKRYPLDLDLTYSVLFRGKSVDSGSGRTVDWSSAGLRFIGERPIGLGRKLELAVRWPLTIDDGAPIKVVISGKTVRTKERVTVVRIDGYEFRGGRSEERSMYRGRPLRRRALNVNYAKSKGGKVPGRNP
jgi:hypothetical protein